MNETVHIFIDTKGCDASWEGEYDASTPVLEILNAYCEKFGLQSASCKLYWNEKELAKSKLLGQALPRASGDCYLEALVQPTLAFFIAHSLGTEIFIRFMETTDRSEPISRILQVVAERFGMDNRVTASIENIDASQPASLVNLDPQQVLPFDMDVKQLENRHLQAAKVSGSVKMLVMLTQVLQTAFECHAHQDAASLEADALNMRSGPQQNAALLGDQYLSNSESAAAGASKVADVVVQQKMPSAMAEAAAVVRNTFKDSVAGTSDRSPQADAAFYEFYATLLKVIDNEYSSPPPSAEQDICSVRSQILVVKLASLVYHDRAPYTPRDVHQLFWQMVSPICRHQAKLVKESSSSPEATLAELSSVEQEVHRLNGILMLVLLPVLKHAVKTLVRQSSDFTRIDPGDAAIATAAATFGLAKLGLILKTGHVASRTELADQLWQSGVLPVLVKALVLAPSLAFLACTLLVALVHGDASRRAVLSRLQGPLHLSQCLETSGVHSLPPCTGNEDQHAKDLAAADAAARLTAVEFIWIILKENPLSDKSLKSAEKAAQLAALNSPVDSSMQGSPASRKHSQDAQSVSRAEGEVCPQTAPSRYAGTASPHAPASPVSPSPAPSSIPSPRLPSVPGQAAVLQSEAGFRSSGSLSLEQDVGFMEACIAEATGLTADGIPVWQTPSPAAWKQIRTIAGRAMHALLELGSHSDFAMHTMLQDALWKLPYELLLGHFADTQLDFEDILQIGVKMASRVRVVDRSWPQLIPLLTQFLLHRLILDMLQGRLKPAVSDNAVRDLLYLLRDLCLPLDSLAPDVRGVARLVVLALYMLPLPTYMYESWSPSYIPGWAQRLMHVKQHHDDQDIQLWTGALILKVCHQQAVANPEAKVLMLKATLPFDFVDLAVLQGIYKQMQLRLQDGPWTARNCAALIQAMWQANDLCMLVPEAMPQASLGFGASLQQSLESVHKLDVDECWQDGVLRSGLLFLATLEADQAQGVKDLSPFLLTLLRSKSQMDPSCQSFAQRITSQPPAAMSLHHVIIHCIASAVNAKDFMQSESTDPQHICTQLLCSVGEQAVQELESAFIAQRYTWLQPFISLIDLYTAVPVVEDVDGRWAMCPPVARASTQLLLLMTQDLKHINARIHEEVEFLREANKGGWAAKAVNLTVAKDGKDATYKSHVANVSLASRLIDLLLTHMERAAEHAQWRRAFSQALLDPSTTKPGHVGVSKEARGGPSSGVLPQQQPHIIFERLYQGGLIGERTWDRLLQVYPQLQKCQRRVVTDQAAAGERGPSGLQNEHDIAAKAAAKKAKKQRQKANKKLTQAQIQDASSSSPAHTSKPQSSTVGSSKSQHSNASSPGSRAVGSIVESRTAEQIKQESADAAMLNIFRCPITKGVMKDPAIASDGHTYERAAVANWLQQHSTSPVTQAPLPHLRLVPNLLIKSAIASQRQQLGQASDF